jgi:hypothetical protein
MDTFNIKTQDLIKTWHYRQRYLTSANLTSITQTLVPPHIKDDENAFVELKDAQQHAYIMFTHYHTEEYSKQYAFWNSRKARIARLYFRIKRDKTSRQQVAEYFENMKKHEAFSILTQDDFLKEHLTITTLPEKYRTHQLLRLSTKLFMLSAQALLKEGVFTLEEDAISALSLKSPPLPRTDMNLLLRYSTLRGHDFDFDHDFPHTDDEWFYADQNKRMFTSRKAALDAANVISPTANIIFKQGDKTTLLTPLDNYKESDTAVPLDNDFSALGPREKQFANIE